MDPRPQNFMETTFRGRNQMRRFEALRQRNLAMTIYYDEPTMDLLGIKDSILYLFSQLGWEKALIKERFVTYRELTLEFLSSLVYIPERGFGSNKGFIGFRLFGIEFVYNHRELADLLGFPSGPFVFTTTQVELMDMELDFFWGTLTGNYHPDPDSMDNNEIHNPAIRYFHKILAHTVFGKEENRTEVSKDEIFLLYCVTQGRPVNVVPFLMQTFERIQQNPNEPIIIGGLVTMLANALGLRYQLHKCIRFGSIRPMNIDFCFERRIIGNLGPAPYEYLIRNEVVTLFTLPNHEKVSVHNRDNWLYELNPPDHPTTPDTPQSYQVFDMSEEESDPETPPGYHDINIDEESDPETPPGYHDINTVEETKTPEVTREEYTESLNKILTTLDAYKTEITSIKDELKQASLNIIGLTDITVEQFYHMNQALEELKKKLG